MTDRLFISGSFSNQIVLGEKLFLLEELEILTSSLWIQREKSFRFFQLGGAGEDVTLDASSAFLRNILLRGISAGVMKKMVILNLQLV